MMRRAFEAVKAFSRKFVGLIYPDICLVCGQTLVAGEDVICLDCVARLPRVHIKDYGENELHQRLASTIPIERAASWFRYIRKSPFCKLIHTAKYNQRPAVGRKLARRVSRELVTKGFFDGIECVIPVPLHWTKKVRRGYNQSDYIARGISDVTGIPVVTDALQARFHISQTSLDSYGRWLNAKESYSLAGTLPTEFRGHLLLVDDVLTTGATLLSCCNAIHSQYPSTKISVLTLALTQQS